MSTDGRPDWLGMNSGKFGIKGGELAERVIERLIARFVHAGDAAIDCGAADGRMLACMLAAAGPHGLVIGFEPIPFIHQALRTRYPHSNVAVVAACVADQQGADVPFYHVKNRRWISSLSPDHLDGYAVESIRVPVTTLDAAVARLGIGHRRIAFIKLDVEGAEFSALKGAKGLVTEHTPFIVFENSLPRAAASFGYDRSEFFEWFRQRGYMLFDVFGTPCTEDHWTERRGELCWNFVAVHSDDPRRLEFLESIGGTLEGIRSDLLRNGFPLLGMQT
ncbi:MAG: FkbM family methyltransferase [Planctomycetia bacterium]